MENPEMNIHESVTLPGKPWRLTSGAYHRMIEAEIFGEGDHLELIDGVLLDMTPQGPTHAGITQKLTSLLVRGVGEGFEVRVQLPLTAGPYSEPEPDFAIVPASKGYTRNHPTTAALVIEIANTSVSFDRSVKSKVYAQAAVPEYWIVNIPERAIEVFRDPDPQTGRYLTLSTLKGSGEVRPTSLPGPVLSCDLLFAD